MSGDSTGSSEGWRPFPSSAVLRLSVAALVPPKSAPWNSPQNASMSLMCSGEGCRLPCPACVWKRSARKSGLSCL
eukprot:3868749-Alexandrium_andersonii.AAC.1